MADQSLAASEATALLSEARRATDAILQSWADQLRATLPGEEGEAIAYALAGPGKRVRPALVLASYRACGGEGEAIATVAAAVETVHTYSLVHDDLPCMDDDHLRRGRPTTHVEFGTATATLVGYRLVPVAARMLVAGAGELGLGESTLSRMAVELFQAGGISGMVGGQWRDLAAEQQRLNLEQLRQVHAEKTGALIRASCLLGGMAAGASDGALESLAAYGLDVGLAFQVADDVLDSTGETSQLGKTAGRDEALAKSTYVQLMGVAGARAEATRLADRAVGHLAGADLEPATLAALAEYIVTRSS